MKRIFGFQGRIGRGEYAAFYLGGWFVCTMLAELTRSFPVLELPLIVIYLASAWLLLSQGAKRCHDRDNSGWFQLVPFYVLWMLFAQGYDGKNRYGPDPRW
jgi:uncharacterized membrane protein YhaH (DUF805 family)